MRCAPISGSGPSSTARAPTTSALTPLFSQFDGKPVVDARGADVGADGVARFDRSGMIRLIARATREKHVLTLTSDEPGVRAFVFTFGP